MKLPRFIIVSNKSAEKPVPAMEYRGLADFLQHASEVRKIEVFTEAARRANEDQRKVFERGKATV